MSKVLPKEKETANKRIERIERSKKRRKKRLTKDEIFESKWN